MTAEPLLELAARLCAKHRLDVVLIGNAAAALQGAPVTTMDLDFMFRKTAGNFMAKVDGIRKFESLRARATAVRFGPHALPVADLADIIRSKTAAGRPQDRAVLSILRKTLRETT